MTMTQNNQVGNCMETLIIIKKMLENNAVMVVNVSTPIKTTG